METLRSEPRAQDAALQRRNGAILNRITQIVFALAGLGVLYILGQAFWDNPSVFVQQMLNGLQLGLIYALLARGYPMSYGIVKLINCAHGDVFMVGAFTSYYVISFLELHRWPAQLWPGLPEGLVVLLGTLTVIAVAMAVTSILAVVMERFAYRPLRDKPRIAALITAIGMSFFLEYFGALPFTYSNNYITLN